MTGGLNRNSNCWGRRPRAQIGWVERGLADQPKQHEPKDDAAKAEEAQLAIAQLKQLTEGASPAARRDQRQDAFDHQHQSQRAPECFSSHTGPASRRHVSQQRTSAGHQRRGAAAGVVVEPELCIALKKSDEGSSTRTSLFLLKLCLYASRLR